MKQLKTSITVAVFSMVVLASVVMLSIIGMSRYTHDIGTKAQSSVLRVGELNFTIGRFEVDFLLARRAEKDFLLRQDEKYVQRHADTMASLFAELDEIKELSSQLGEFDNTAGEIARLRTAVVEYQNAFEALVASKRRLGLDENSGLQGELRQSIHGIEAVLEQSGSHELTAKMLMMRRHEKDFILRNDVAYLGALNTRVEEFRSFPPSLFDSPVQQAEIYQLLSAYQAAFAAFVLETVKERDLRKTLSAKFAEVEPLLNVVHIHALDRLKNVLAETEATSQSIQKRTLVAGLIGLIVFVLISISVAQAISHPLRRVHIALKEMLKGDFSRVLPPSRITEISAVASAVEDFRGARDKALAGERAKSNLLTVMSHEMRTPLTGVLGSLDLLDDTETTQEQDDYVQAMRVSGELLLHHVNEVLELSGLDADISARKPVAFNLEELMRGLVSSQKANARARGNTLELHCRLKDAANVLGRPTQLQKAMLNLIGNALKFTNKGLVTVDVTRLIDGNQVEFLIRDSGIGIAPTDLKRIFEDFVTLDANYGRTSEGTGLGLAITRRVVEAMGGFIEAESILGQGSQFRVVLPLPKAATQQKSEPVKSQNLSDAKHLLIVEDNDINRVLLDKTLQHMGHRVTTAADGAEAVEATRHGQFDLILMDISMPVVDGIEAHRQIRAQKLAEGVNIVALTAHVGEEDRRCIMEAGFQDMASKPISRVELAKLISRYAGSKTPS